MILTLSHILLNLLLLLSSLLVFLIENTIHSLLLLILSFLNAAFICFFFGAEFLGLSLIIIYVGAIAILFLFVIMMLNVKIQLIGILKYFPFLLLFGLIFFIQIFNITNMCFSNFDNIELFFFFESLTSEFFLGQILYNYFLICFLLAGLLLLIGMIGAIILTLNFNNKILFEKSFRQLSRSHNFLSFFK